MSKQKGAADPHDPRLSKKEARRIRRKREFDPLVDKDPLEKERKLGMSVTLVNGSPIPQQVRAFGILLHKREEYESPFYSGSKPGCPTINLMQEKDGTWRAAALFTSVTVLPRLSSASIPAALRNLRGHLGNLAIDLDKLGIKPRWRR